jgi:hypothetical protein
MMEWAGPSLVEHKFKAKSGNKEVIARLGFPRPSDKAPDEWACDFQLAGWKDGRIRVAYGVDGMQALAIAAGEMRRSLGEIKGLIQSDEAYELVFPRFVPISYGLEFHRHLCGLLDEEIEKKEREIEKRTALGPRSE